MNNNLLKNQWKFEANSQVYTILQNQSKVARMYEELKMFENHIARQQIIWFTSNRTAKNHN